MHRIIVALNKLDPYLTWLTLISGVGILSMSIFIFYDVAMRYVFNRPTGGGDELVSLAMAFVSLGGLADVQMRRGHTSMDIVVSRLKPRSQLIVDNICLLLSMVFFVFPIWMSCETAIHLVNKTPVLGIPYGPFMLIVALMSVLLIVQFIRQFLANTVEGIELGFDVRQWAMIFGIPLLISIGTGFLILRSPLPVDPSTLGLIGLAFMFVLFSVGLPVGFAMMIIGFVFLIFIRGMPAGLDMLAQTWFNTVSNYSWTPIMLFIFMGIMCFYGELGKDLFGAAYSWMGHIHGGLAMAVVAACTAFGAVVGDPLIGSITMAKVALPQMREYKYSDILSIGTICASGTLGTLIPPSIVFVVYGVLAGQSIGRLFIAGIFPGLLCATLFIIYIYIRCRLDPTEAFAGERSSWKSRLISLRVSAPIAVLFVLVMGGIWGGVFTPTEAGGIGAFGATALTFVSRRLSWSSLRESMLESARICVNIFTLLGGAAMLGYFLAISDVPHKLALWVGIVDTSILAMAMIVLILSILGCFMSMVPIVLICVPMFLPIAKHFGWNLIWFGVIITLLSNLGNLTPPYGMNLFVVKGVANVPIGLVYRSIMPFCLAIFVCVIIIIAFPAISTFLPSLIH